MQPLMTRTLSTHQGQGGGLGSSIHHSHCQTLCTSNQPVYECDIRVILANTTSSHTVLECCGIHRGLYFLVQIIHRCCNCYELQLSLRQHCVDLLKARFAQASHPGYTAQIHRETISFLQGSHDQTLGMGSNTQSCPRPWPCRHGLSCSY